MKKLFTLFLLLLTYQCFSQNLVPNGNFEKRLDCPKQTGKLTLCDGWYSPSNATPDYYHTCASGDVSVPKHPGGYQLPRSGDGYTGIFLGHFPATSATPRSYREYLGSRLASEMTPGKRYCVSVSVAFPKLGKYAVDQLSIYFTRDSLYAATNDNIQVTPQLDLPPNTYLQDTVNWMTIKWDYVADSNYKWITIGNFRDYSKTKTVTLRNHNDAESRLSYYYVDDVSVVPLPNDTGWLPDVRLVCNNPVDVNAGVFDQYLWSTGATTAAIKISDTGKYWVKVINACGIFSDSFEVTNIDTTKTKFTVPDKEIICNLLYVVGLPQYDSYLWSDGSTARSNFFTKGGNYWVTVKNSCGVYTDTFAITNKDTTSAPLTVNDAFMTCNKPIEVAPHRNYKLYQWSTGEITPSITIRTPGTYWLKASNHCGEYTDTFIIENGGCVFIPDIFSPNGDGINDLFKPRGIINRDGYKFNIYNRWGEQVFTSTDISQGWNGMHMAMLADIGVYYWQLTYREPENREVFKKGSVTIIR